MIRDEGSRRAAANRWDVRAAVLGAALLATSCLGPDLKVASEAQTGCQADEIAIVNEERGAGHITWTAWCRGQPYLCSGGAGSISCQAVYPRQPVPAQTGVARASDRTGGVANKQAWVRFELRDCGISAEFPGTPTAGVQQVGKGATSAAATTATFEVAAGALTVGCSKLPKNNAPMNVMLDGTRNGMLKKVSGKLLKESDIIGGREVWFDVQGHLAVARILMATDRLVMAMVIPANAFGAETAKRFFDSVSSITP